MKSLRLMQASLGLIAAISISTQAGAPLSGTIIEGKSAPGNIIIGQSTFSDVVAAYGDPRPRCFGASSDFLPNTCSFEVEGLRPGAADNIVMVSFAQDLPDNTFSEVPTPEALVKSIHVLKNVPWQTSAGAQVRAFGKNNFCNYSAKKA